jgi:hypothetical protein
LTGIERFAYVERIKQVAENMMAARFAKIFVPTDSVIRVLAKSTPNKKNDDNQPDVD